MTGALLVPLARRGRRGRPTARASNGSDEVRAAGGVAGRRPAALPRSVPRRPRLRWRRRSCGIRPCRRSTARNADQAVRAAARAISRCSLNIVLTDRDGRRARAVGAAGRPHRRRQAAARWIRSAGRSRPASRSSASCSPAPCRGKPTVVLGLSGARRSAARSAACSALGTQPGAAAETLFASVPLPDGSVVTLTDRPGPRAGAQPRRRRYIGTTDRAARRRRCARCPGRRSDRDRRRRARLRQCGRSIAARGSLSVGIPTQPRASTRLAPLWRAEPDHRRCRRSSRCCSSALGLLDASHEPRR